MQMRSLVRRTIVVLLLAAGNVNISAAGEVGVLSLLPFCWQQCLTVNVKCGALKPLPCSCHYASQPNTFPQLLNCVVEKCNDASLPGHLVGPFGAITAFCSQTTYTIPESAISAMSVAAEEAKKTLSAPHMLGTQKPTQAAGWKSGHKYSGTAHAMVDGGGILTPPMVLLIQSTAFDAASTSAMSTASAQTSSSSADSQIATAPATTPSIPAASTTSSKAATTSTGGGILLDRARVDSMRLLGMIGLFGLGAWFLAAYI